jgi:hypothetical protein
VAPAAGAAAAAAAAGAARARRNAPRAAPTVALCSPCAQARFATMLLAGEKTVELRRYAIPEAYLGAGGLAGEGERGGQGRSACNPI